MVRTQIQLTDFQASLLKRAAGMQGVSMAELIRQAVDAFVARMPVDGDSKKKRALAALGAFDSNPDLSVRHDAFAFGEEQS